MATHAHLECNARYHSKLDDIKIRVPKGKREELKRYASEHSESLQSWIIRLLEQDSGIVLREKDNAE